MLSFLTIPATPEMAAPPPPSIFASRHIIETEIETGSTGPIKKVVFEDKAAPQFSSSSIIPSASIMHRTMVESSMIPDISRVEAIPESASTPTFSAAESSSEHSIASSSEPTSLNFGQTDSDSSEPTVIAPDSVIPATATSPEPPLAINSGDLENEASAPRTNSSILESSTPTTSATDEALFETIFGQPRTNRNQIISVPFFVNDNNLGSLLIEITDGTEAEQPKVEAQALLNRLQEGLHTESLELLQAAITDQGQLTLSAIRAAGLEAEFNPQRLEFRLQIPPELRKQQVSFVSEDEIPASAATALAPSTISGYLNLRGTQSFNWVGESESLGRQPLSLNLEGVLNWQGWVLEGGLNFNERTQSPWQRSNLRLVRDAPAQAVRYTLGEISSPPLGYQRGVPMLGVALTRNFSLQPFRRITPINQFEFFLARPSRVDVIVNGQRANTLRLEAGAQDIRDLPLTRGINEIQLVITDDLGQINTLDFAKGVAGNLLAPNTQKFAYSLGFQRTESGLGYDLSQPVLSLAHQVGLSNTLTLGGYFQGDFSRQLFGITGNWATPLGNVGWDGALSTDSTYGSDVAVKLIYELLTRSASSHQQRNLQLALEYRGANFLALTDALPSNATELDLSLAYRQPLFSQVQASFNARYQIGRGEVGDAYSLNIGLSRPINRHLSLNLGFNHGVTATGQSNQRVSLGMSMTLPQRGQNILSQTALSNSGEPTSQLTWNVNSPVVRGGIGTSFVVGQSSDAYNFENQLNYHNARANISLRQQLTLPRNQPTPMGLVSTLTWGTALAFADGQFGWSRPIDNSFALFARQGTTQGQLVRVNPSQQGAIAQADGLGAAVVGLQPYALNNLTIDAPHLPIGYDLGPASHTLIPGYRSGTLIQVGTDATVFLRGTLVDAADQPISLQQGQITSLSDPDWPAIDLFTNRTGRFALFGFKPGQYQLRLTTSSEAVLRFSIEDHAEGQHDIGILQMPMRLTER